MWATNKEIIKMSKISVNKKLKGSALIIASMLLTLLMTGCHKHVYAPATCTLPPTCTECGKTEGEALGHIFGAATCEEPSTCSRCGQTQGDPNGHKWEDATCEEASYCSVCGKTEGVALGHDSTEATCTEPAVCKICGKQTAEKIAHKYSEGNCIPTLYVKNVVILKRLQVIHLLKLPVISQKPVRFVMKQKETH